MSAATDLLDPEQLDEELIEKLIANCVVSRVFFVEHILGVEYIEDWQREVLEALDSGETRISIRSGHGVGKTTLCSWVALHFLLFRNNVKIPVTAPSSSQMEDGLIPEIKKWIGVLPEFLSCQIEMTEKRIKRIDDQANNFISFRTARADAPEALAGIHADHVMAVVDEASGVPEAVYEAAAGTMSTPGAIFILIGNPTRKAGYFFRTQTNPSSGWYVRKVSCFDSTRVDQAFINGIIRDYGLDSAQYFVRVLGEFAPSNADTVIPRNLVESAVDRDIDRVVSQSTVWGLDPGRGGDPSGFVIREGNVVTHIEEFYDLDTMSLVGRIKERWDETNFDERPEVIYIDSIGLGGPIADRLRELGLPAVDVNVSESPSMKSRYPRLRAELWYTAREWFESRTVAIKISSNLLDKFVEELSELRVKFTSNGRNDVESKRDAKARSVSSPNMADALIITFVGGNASALGRSNKSGWGTPLEYRPPSLY